MESIRFINGFVIMKMQEESFCLTAIYQYNGETTEIDVLLIKLDGIFVFESKNYSGWIYGDEKSKNWTQTLPQGKGKSHKEYFFNPIIQNNVHIKCLRSILSEDLPIYSIIAFSKRCTLKKVNITSQDIQGIKRQEILRAVEYVLYW